MAASFQFLAIVSLLLVATPAAALPPVSTTLTPLTVSANTGEKPQSKVWTHDGRWFCVMPSTSVTPAGTWVWRLDGAAWTNVLQLSTATGTHADVKATGAVSHVLLYNAGSSQLASIEYVPATQTYQMWTTRPANVALPLSASTETASLDIDSQGRMWIATDYAGATSQVVVYYADAPYGSWSSPVTVATGINADDIAVVTAMPGGQVGVLWSNQNTQRFGFKRHVDGADPGTWSIDEVPASQSAQNVGLGMADDHMNVAVASDGTLYAAVKTSYDAAGYPKIALLVRRPAGTWDNLYEVDQAGTRGIVLLDETAGVVTVLYTSVEGAGNILYKETPTAAIAFGASTVLMPGGLNDVTSTKQNLAGSAVILAGSGTSLSGRLLTTPVASYTITASAGAGGTITPSGAVSVNAGASQAFTIAPSGGYVIADVLVDGGSVGAVANYTFTNVTASHTIAASFAPDPGTGLVGRWRMNEGSGVTVADDSPNGLNGTVVGSPAWVAGIEGPFALSFTNGSSQRVQVPDVAALDFTSAITLAAWIRPTQLATASILDKATFTSGVYGYELNLSTTGVPFVRLFNDTQAIGGGRLNATVPYPTDGTTWMHVAATYDGAMIRMYINGVLDTTRAATSPLTTNTLPLVIGAPSDGAASRVFPGAIDDARLYNRALTDADIAAIADLGPTWTITAGAGAGGTITPSGAVVVSAGASQAFTIAPNGGYVIADVLVDGGSVGAVASYTFANVAASHTIAASFSAVNAAPGQPVLAAPADGATDISPSPTLDVIAADPDSPSLTVNFYGRVASAPAGPDFTLIGLPDTQYYTGQLNGGRNIMFQTQTNWIVANKAARNIVYTVQLGDCTEHGDNGGDNIEWLRADTSLTVLENPLTTGLPDGIPYGVCVGNHDQSAIGNPDGTTTFFNQFFGVDRFAGRPYYGGHFADNNDTHFDLFSASGMDFIVICFEYDTTPDANALNWADSLLTVYADRRAIVASHWIVNSGNPASFGGQGQAIYNALRGHSNLFMMLGGHVSTEGRRQDTFNGNTVYSMLSDYQGRAGGGNGWLRILEFSPANNVVRVRTYSPWLDQFETDADSSSQFTLAYPMSSAGTYQLVGTVSNVSPGSHATLAWPGLVQGAEYEWYVTVSDGASTTTSSPTWSFTTGSDVTPPDPVGNLVATPVTSGNDTSGRTRIALNWSGAEAGAAAKVYRKGYGDYPFYGAGAAPAAPANPTAAVAAGWTLTGVSAPGNTDQPPGRDQWFYVLFLTDASGNTSAVSNRTGGTLDYLLGDVSNGAAACAGDNGVGSADVSLLGAHYGMTVSGSGDPYACLDVAPTVDRSTTARPAPDGRVQFEDLVLFSINFTGLGAPVAVESRPGPGVSAANALALDVPVLPGVGESFTLTVRASGSGDVHALSLDLGYDEAVVEMTGVDGGELLDRQGAQAVTLSPQAGRVDIALLGAGAGLAGEGVLARVWFRVKAAGQPAFTIRSADGRDGANRQLVLAGAQSPSPASDPVMTQLGYARPNPFTQAVSIGFSLAMRGPVEAAIYDVNGRCVRTMARGMIEAGEHTLTWDGRDDRGAAAAAGAYYLRLVTEQGRFTRVLTYLK